LFFVKSCDRDRGARVAARALLGALICAGSIAGLAAPAAAQSVVEPTFSVQRFQPAPGPRNFLMTRGARVDGRNSWSAGGLIHYAFEPLTVESCVSDDADDCSDADARATREVKVVENLLTADLMGSFTPAPMVQLGLRIPVAWIKGQGLDARGSADEDGLEAIGVGDVEVEAKLRAAGNPRDPMVVGVAVSATAPIGYQIAKDEYLGDKTPTGGVRLIVDGLSGPLSYAVNVGGLLRGEGQLGSTKVGSELRYSAGVGYQVGPVFRAVVDAFGSTRFSGESGENPLEAVIAAQIQPLGFPAQFTVGAGTGLIDALGVPTVRGMLGVVYVNEFRDDDRDGIQDDNDQCPSVAEDKDGYEDSDGCPDGDNDLDTIPDSADKCPSQAEDQDGFDDADGCPDLDNDKDGFADTADQCPAQPESKNDYKDEDGCPDEADNDNDGVPDARDKCVQEAEDTDGFDDTDGCPDPDNDADGVADGNDECAEEQETTNGFEDEDGCPDTPPRGFRPPKKTPEL
jgi:OmpA-OmpF porin, OOP family